MEGDLSVISNVECEVRDPQVDGDDPAVQLNGGLASISGAQSHSL